jgi:hypothetical protein
MRAAVPQKIQIGERFTEIGHERLDIVVTAPRRMQRVLQQHFGSCQLVDNAGIVRLPLELGEPATDDGLVILLLTHLETPCVVIDLSEGRDIPSRRGVW